MKTVLVAGGASGVGTSVVRMLLASGEAKVVATSRSAERLEEQRERLDPKLRASLTSLVGDAGDFAGASKIVEQVGARGGADAVVAILGRGWWTSGPLLDVTPHEWTAILDEMLTGHFAFARAVIPSLAARPGSLYLSIGGGAAFAPMPDGGLVSIAAAGQVMLTRTLARERGDAPPRILELVIDGPVNTAESRHFANSKWIVDDDVGRVVTELVLDGATTWEPTRTNGALIVMQERR